MTKDEARRMVKAFRDFMGATGMWTSSGGGFGGLIFSTTETRGQMIFNYEGEALVCRAELDELRTDPKPGEIEAFREEEKAGAPTGGGQFEYTPADRGLYLTRIYREPVDSKTFINDMQKLAQAAIHWQDEVSERVYDRVFGRTPAPSSPSPDRPDRPR